MRKRKKFLPFLFLFFLSLLASLFFILFIDPEQNFEILTISFPPFYIFLSTLYITLFSLFSFLFLNKKRGFLIAGFFVSIIILRLFGITNYYYLIILALIFILINFLSAKERVKPQNLQNQPIIKH